MNRTLVDGVHWVGHVDWNIRDFHGYVTDRGSTYNSYLVLDEEPALIDAVKAPYAGELLRHIGERMDPAALRWVVCNHAEPDHSGALPAVMAAAPGATLVCDAKCKAVLDLYYDTAGWTFRIVRTGDTLPLGARTLEFIETPMAHWPESMATWIPQERLLFSMDAFGQHYATSGRFDDEVPESVLYYETKTYVANILMLYSMPVAKAVAAGAWTATCRPFAAPCGYATSTSRLASATGCRRARWVSSRRAGCTTRPARCSPKPISATATSPGPHFNRRCSARWRASPL